MIKTNQRKAWIIFCIYIVATFAFLFLGYSVQKPSVSQKEFPFTITYSYQGQSATISDVYVAEYAPKPQYIGEHSLFWNGYIKDHNRLEADFYRIAEQDGQSFSINLNISAGYLMGDPEYADTECCPTLVCHSFDGTNEIEVTDPSELEKMGFYLVSWEYPAPIVNSFSFGGLSLSSEASFLTAAIAILALLACLILIRKEKDLRYRMLDIISIVGNFLIIFLAFPFILIVSALSEIVADVTFLQQLLYISPALVVLSVAASVTMRRMDYKIGNFLIQFAGPAIFSLLILITSP